MEKNNSVKIGQIRADVTNNRHINSRLMFNYNLIVEKLDSGAPRTVCRVLLWNILN